MYIGAKTKKLRNNVTLAHLTNIIASPILSVSLDIGFS
jgi:hypothetical protein